MVPAMLGEAREVTIMVGQPRFVLHDETDNQTSSGFFGTGLSSALTAAGVDTLIVTGASTSGCVRATVVDALQHGFRPVVPRDAVGDRNLEAHEANLHDMDAKYGDVLSVNECLTYLEKVRSEATRTP